MKARVLIIEDEPEISELMALYLSREGLDVIRCGRGEEGLALLEREPFDLLILDLNLPGMDGYEVLQALRQTRTLPVMIVSARTDDADMILGFGYGADDFVQKPFSPRVLAARVRAHLRRRQRESQATRSDEICFGPYELDGEGHVLFRRKSSSGGGAPRERVALSPKEMDLLLALAAERGRSLPQETLFQQVWGSAIGDLATVSVHIQRLRRKIEEDPSQPRYILTEHGFGYRLCGEEEVP